MRIGVMSDLHSEFHKDSGKAFVSSCNPTSVDILVVPGDATATYRGTDIFRLLCDAYPRVLYVPGNHDYYNSSWEETWETFDKLQLELPNLTVMNRTEAIIDGQSFLGTTLWFKEYPVETLAKSMYLNDFHLIKNFRQWVFAENRKSQKWLEDNTTSDSVVITHHVPLLSGSQKRWQESPLNKLFFVHDMSDMIRHTRPKLWLYGHTHDHMDFLYADTHFVCNPLGYPTEETGYVENFTVTI